MFFVLSKLLTFFIHPFSWVIIFVTFGWFTKRTKWKKGAYMSAVIFVVFFSNTVIFSEFARLWETEGTKIEQVKHYDVAIVLGGMAEFDNNLGRLSLRRGGDRIWQTLQLYYAGKVEKIMVVGANGDLTDKGLNEAVQFKENLLNMGIPEEDLIIETNSKNTYQNAVEAKKVMAEYGSNNKVLLVTSALHMRRSRACFSAAGFSDFGTFTTDHYTGAKRGYSFEQFIIPNVSTMTDWSRLLHEQVGYLMYWVMGYI